ncbi:MAG: hypothetical protein IJ172_12850 [Ruminococcus sp.]|nr:hypothetical protein [Ruminococcus sp.]
MSNLGWYQLLTTLAKKVGGPKKLVLLLVGSGAVIGGSATAGGLAVKKKVKKTLDKKKKNAEAAIVHTVIQNGVSNEGKTFTIGDKFKVLEVDGDAGLIELIGDNNSPYYVSTRFLNSISDYNPN